MSEDKLIEHSGTFIGTQYSPASHQIFESTRVNLLTTFMEDRLSDLLGSFKPFLRAGYCTIGNYDTTTVRLDLLRLPDDVFDRFCMAYMLTMLGGNSELFQTGYKGWDAVYLVKRQLEILKPTTLTFQHNAYEMLRRIGRASSTCADLKGEFEDQQNKEKDEESIWRQTSSVPDNYFVNICKKTFKEMDVGYDIGVESISAPMFTFETFRKIHHADSNSAQALYIAVCAAIRNLTITDPRLPTDVRCKNLTRTDFYTPGKEPT
jgi:hypothetical protein